jgi:hypothetical protein
MSGDIMQRDRGQSVSGRITHLGEVRLVRLNLGDPRHEEEAPMTDHEQTWAESYAMGKIDYTKLALPKNPPARDKAYLAYVREQICAVYGNDCGGVTEAAHIGTTGRGMKSSDLFTIPLCSRHHRESHDVGIITFQANHLLDVWAVCAHTLAKWIKER